LYGRTGLDGTPLFTCIAAFTSHQGILISLDVKADWKKYDHIWLFCSGDWLINKNVNCFNRTPYTLFINYTAESGTLFALIDPLSVANN